MIDDPTTGIIVKIPGELKTNPETGQITGVFDQNPQLPFSELKLRFFGGPRGGARDAADLWHVHDRERFRTVVGAGIGAGRDAV